LPDELWTEAAEEPGVAVFRPEESAATRFVGLDVFVGAPRPGDVATFSSAEASAPPRAFTLFLIDGESDFEDPLLPATTDPEPVGICST
jgi:hypothetical protein